MTLEGWARCVKLWADVWPERPLAASSIETWFELLRDVDDEAAFATLVAWARDPERKWPPASPGELRGACEPDDDDWTEALARLTREVRREGSYGRPDFDDEPALRSFVESMGGWRMLCSSFDPTDSTTRAQFRDYWRTMRRREVRESAAALPAAGILPTLQPGRD